MKRIVFIGLVTLVLAALLASGACAETKPTPTAEKTGTLKVGGTMPLSGPASLWGETMTKKAATKLLDVYNVNAIVGGWMSPIVSLLSDVATERNVVYINGLVTIPGYTCLSPEKPTTFSNLHNCYYWNAVDANYFIKLVEEKVLDSKVVAVLCGDDPIQRSVLEALKAHDSEWQKQFGVKQVYWEIFPLDTTDFRPWLLKIASLPEKVDTIVGDQLPFHLAMIAKQGYEINPQWRYVVPCYFTDTREFVDMAGYEAAQNCYTAIGNPWQYESITPEYLDMVNRVRDEYKVKYGEEMTFGGGLMFLGNQLAIYLEGCKLAGSIETEDVVQALENFKDLPHFYGPTKEPEGEKTFGINHFIANRSAVMGKVEGYEHVPVMELEIPPLP